MTFQVAVDNSAIEFACEAGETVLDAAERAGFSLPYSCRKGACSTCEAELCRGNVALGSKHIAGPKSGILLCQAKPQTDILIHPKRIERHGRGNTRRVRFYWGGRREQDLYLADLPKKWEARTAWLKFTPVLSEPNADWSGATGLVHQAVLRDIPDLSGWQVYACGNPLMVRHAQREFQSLGGLPDDQFFADLFVSSGNAKMTKLISAG
jgi:ferredoxin